MRCEERCLEIPSPLSQPRKGVARFCGILGVPEMTGGWLVRVTVCLAMVFGLIGAASLAAGALPSHLDKSKNHGGCSGCHAGHGKRGTPMLRGSNQEFCYNCHGLGAKTDIYSVFNKRSKHPVST